VNFVTEGNIDLKIAVSLVDSLHCAAMGVTTLADKLVCIIAKGIELADSIHNFSAVSIIFSREAL